MSNVQPFSYFLRMKRNNPAAFHTLATHKQMIQSQVHLGEEFYDTSHTAEVVNDAN